MYILKSILHSFVKYSAFKQLMTILAFLANLVPFSAIFLFVVITWTISVYCLKLFEEILSCPTPNRHNIFEWKRKFDLIGNSIDLINNTFGFILLLTVTHSVIFLLTHGFYLLNRTTITKELDIVFITIRIIFYFGLLFFVVYTPTHLYQKVQISLISLKLFPLEIHFIQ